MTSSISSISSSNQFQDVDGACSFVQSPDRQSNRPNHVVKTDSLQSPDFSCAQSRPVQTSKIDFHDLEQRANCFPYKSPQALFLTHSMLQGPKTDWDSLNKKTQCKPDISIFNALTSLSCRAIQCETIDLNDWQKTIDHLIKRRKISKIFINKAKYNYIKRAHEKTSQELSECINCSVNRVSLSQNCRRLKDQYQSQIDDLNRFLRKQMCTCRPKASETDSSNRSEMDAKAPFEIQSLDEEDLQNRKFQLLIQIAYQLLMCEESDFKKNLTKALEISSIICLSDISPRNCEILNCSKFLSY